MDNPGQTEMALVSELAEKVLPVDERNDLLKKFEKEILGMPVFKPGQYVEASELGLRVGVLDAGALAIVLRAGSAVAADVEARTGFKNQNVEIQLFNENGHLVKRAFDSRFLKGVKV